MNKPLNLKDFIKKDCHGDVVLPGNLTVTKVIKAHTPSVHDTSNTVPTTEWVRDVLSTYNIGTGSKWYTGTTAPLDTFGLNNDMYLITSTGAFYRKESDVWVLKGDIVGAQGPAGNTGPAGPQGIKGDTGLTGPQGPIGLTGPAGPKGDTGAASTVPGPIGPTGLTGLQGIKGDRGATGATGPIGPQGPQGIPGCAGLDGPIGPAGPTGAMGPQGPAGIQGPKGDKGDKGETGIQGLTGPRGPQGDKGNDGAQGVQGIQGPIGPAGTGLTLLGTVANVAALPSSGNTQGDAYIVTSPNGDLYVWSATAGTWENVGNIVGPQGPQGIQGIQGIKGDQGIQGVKGDTGLKGDKGDTGLKGDTGTAATITLGTVSTGAAGSNVAITNSGTTAAAIFNFTIPRGDTGSAGAAATISLGTVTTGAAGTNAAITNSGTSAAAIFNFTIPQGAKGDKGDTGTGFTSISPAANNALVISNGTANSAFTNPNIYVDGNTIKAGGFFQVSARATKTDISVFDSSALDIIRKTQIVNFAYKSDPGVRHIGFIAEDTPVELSSVNQNVMDTNSSLAVALKAIQELEARIKVLENEG